MAAGTKKFKQKAESGFEKWIVGEVERAEELLSFFFFNKPYQPYLILQAVCVNYFYFNLVNTGGKKKTYSTKILL